MGIVTTALRNKKNTSNSQKKYLTSLPQRIACYLTAYFDEKSPFERVVHFEVFNVHDHLTAGAWAACEQTNKFLLHVYKRTISKAVTS